MIHRRLITGWISRNSGGGALANRPGTFAVLLAIVISVSLAPTASADRAPQAWWYHWWETERDRYLGETLAARNPNALEPGDSDAARAHRAKAAEGLLKASSAGSARLRAAAALSLGRMEHGPALERLVALTRDADQDVRSSAWVALGLFDTQPARDALFGSRKLKEMDAAAWIAAATLLEKLDDGAIRALVSFVDQHKSPEVQRLAVRALRVHNPPINRKVMYAVLNRGDNPFAAVEAILALGAAHDERDVEFLIEMLHMLGAAERLPLVRVLTKQADKSDGTVSQHAEVMLRASAAMALVPQAENHERRRRIRKVLGEVPLTDYGLLEYRPRASLVALGQIGHSDDVPDLLRVLNAEFDRGPRGTQRTHDPRLGYAAIGLGLYVRQFRTSVYGQLEPTDRDKDRINEVMRALSYGAKRRTETKRFRAACMMGLGLADHQDSARLIMDGFRRVGKKDEIIYGYGILAMGLVRDERLLPAAKKYLAGERDLATMEQMLKSGLRSKPKLKSVMGRRAAVLGLALLGDKRDAPVLTRRWGNNKWVSLEVARALAWCESYELTDRLLTLMKQTEREDLAAMAAQCLGEMFDAHRPSRLQRLMTGNSYFTPHSKQRRNKFGPEAGRLVNYQLPDCHAYANPFFYRRYLPIQSIWW